MCKYMGEESSPATSPYWAMATRGDLRGKLGPNELSLRAN